MKVAGLLVGTLSLSQRVIASCPTALNEQRSAIRSITENLVRTKEVVEHLERIIGKTKQLGKDHENRHHWETIAAQFQAIHNTLKEIECIMKIQTNRVETNIIGGIKRAQGMRDNMLKIATRKFQYRETLRVFADPSPEIFASVWLVISLGCSLIYNYRRRDKFQNCFLVLGIVLAPAVSMAIGQSHSILRDTKIYLPWTTLFGLLLSAGFHQFTQPLSYDCDFRMVEEENSKLPELMKHCVLRTPAKTGWTFCVSMGPTTGYTSIFSDQDSVSSTVMEKSNRKVISLDELRLHRLAHLDIHEDICMPCAERWTFSGFSDLQRRCTKNPSSRLHYVDKSDECQDSINRHTRKRRFCVTDGEYVRLGPKERDAGGMICSACGAQVLILLRPSEIEDGS